MFKTLPIRSDCPICKGKFEGPEKEGGEAAGKKKKGDDGEITIEPHVKKLYEMTFTKRMINLQMVNYIQK